MVYKINSRLRRFGYGMGQITGLSDYYIGPLIRRLGVGNASPRTP